MKPIRLTKRERREIEEACDQPVNTAPRFSVPDVIEVILFIAAGCGVLLALHRAGLL